MMTDPIADMLSRIKNAMNAKHTQVTIPYSKIKEQIAGTFAAGGFIDSVDAVGEGVGRQLVLNLKYEDKTPVIRGLKRISTPGRRVYVSVEEIKPFKRGFGMSVLTTSKGILSDAEAKKQNVGGEVVCAIW